MPATPISSHLPGLAPSMNPREPAKMASHAHQPANPRARTTPKPPRALEDGLPRTPTSKSPGSPPPKKPLRARKNGLPRTPTSRFPGSHYPKTPASPQKRLLTHTNQQVHGLAPPQNPREPAKTASHPHQPASPRARTTSKPPRAREDGLSRTPTSKSPGSHHTKVPREPAKMASDRRPSVNE